MEAGGIFLLSDMDDKLNAAAFTALLNQTPEAKVGRNEWARLADILAKEVQPFFGKGLLSPGSYTLENYHTAYAENGAIQFNADGDAPTPLPAGKTFTFTVTTEHLALLRRMNVRSWQSYVEVMDPKRPYGDMTYYFIDMADALGDKIPRNAAKEAAFSAQQIARYKKLHREMLFAVQAFWKYAQYTR